MKLGGFEEELTQLSVGVAWLVVHIGGWVLRTYVFACWGYVPTAGAHGLLSTA